MWCTEVRGQISRISSLFPPWVRTQAYSTSPLTRCTISPAPRVYKHNKLGSSCSGPFTARVPPHYKDVSSVILFLSCSPSQTLISVGWGAGLSFKDAAERGIATLWPVITAPRKEGLEASLSYTKSYLSKHTNTALKKLQINCRQVSIFRYTEPERKWGERAV